jgi:hypothetical protein
LNFSGVNMPRGRKKGSKNHKTLWRELEKLIELENLDQPLDPLAVIEQVMNYFYSMAEAMRKTPDATLSQIASFYEKAGKFAALAAPYRQGRLSAIKLLGDPNVGTGPFKPDATLEELREELTKRVAAMVQEGVIDLQALPSPEPKVAN